MTGVPLAVLWDADGVLQRVPHGAEESMRPAVEGLVGDLDGFLAEAVAAERPALTGHASWPAVLPGLLERWGIADRYEHVVRRWLSIEPVDGSRALVRAVRAAGTPCHLATNQARERAEVMRRDLGYVDLVDRAFWSYELGVAKPDPAYFETILDALGVAAGSVVLVDDNPRNVAVARSLGMLAEEWSWREDVEVLRRRLASHGVPGVPGVPRTRSTGAQPEPAGSSGVS